MTKGTITDEQGNPLADARVAVCEGNVELLQTSSDRAGGFHFELDAKYGGSLLTVKVARARFLPESKAFRAGEVEHLKIVLKPDENAPSPGPTFWEQIKKFWLELGGLKKAVILGLPALCLIVVAILLLRHHPTDGQNPGRETDLQRTVSVALNAPNTNLTLQIPSKDIVVDVSVRLNGGMKEVFTNTDPEKDPFVISPAPLRSISLKFADIQINDLPPKRYIFMSEDAVKVEAAAADLHDAMISIQQIALATSLLQTLTNQPDHSSKTEQTARNALDRWTREYSDKIARLVDCPDDTLKETLQSFTRGGKNAADAEALQSLANVIAQHRAEVRKSGKLPDDYVQQLLAAYSKFPKGLKIE